MTDIKKKKQNSVTSEFKCMKSADTKGHAAPL